MNNAHRHAIEGFAWTEEKIARLKQMVADGVSYPKIGVILGCGKNAAIGKARRLGCGTRTTPGKRPYNRTPQEKLDEILALSKRGFSRNQIRERLRVDTTTIVNVLGRAVRMSPKPKVPPMIRSRDQADLPLSTPAARPAVNVQPVIPRARYQCEFLIGAEKPWARCGEMQDAGSVYCRAHSLLCYPGWRERVAA